MNLNGNNAEKIATTIIMFIVMFLAYLLVSLIFNYLSNATLDSVVKDGMEFAATGIAPIVAILLYSDWRHEFVAVNNRNASIAIKDIVEWLINSLHSYTQRIETSDSFLEYRSTYYKKLIEFKKQVELLQDVDKDLHAYKKNCVEVEKLLFKCGNNFQNIYFSRISENRDDESITNDIKQNKICIIGNLSKLQELLEHLKILEVKE